MKATHNHIGSSYSYDEALDGMRRAGRLVAEAMDLLVNNTREGVTTQFLDELAYKFILEHGAQPASLNYRGYPKTICTSVNHVVCHGIPCDRVLKRGDIVNVDLCLILNGWYGDTSRMVAIGEISAMAKRLCHVTFQAMLEGIKVVHPQSTTYTIGKAIETYVQRQGFSVVRDFCGHGIGRSYHEQPSILHFADAHYTMPLKPGQFITVEPMVNVGRCDVKILQDGWTAVTRDRSLSAQYEHTVAVTHDGYEILTLSPEGLDQPVS